MVTSAQIDGGVYGKVRYSMLGCDNVSRVKAFGTQELLKSPCSLYGITVSDAEFTFFTQYIKACAADIFPGMNCLLRAFIILPMTSCSVERLFSATHRINTRLRASMVTERLNNLTLLSFERELTEHWIMTRSSASLIQNPGDSA